MIKMKPKLQKQMEADILTDVGTNDSKMAKHKNVHAQRNGQMER